MWSLALVVVLLAAACEAPGPGDDGGQEAADPGQEATEEAEEGDEADEADEATEAPSPYVPGEDRGPGLRERTAPAHGGAHGVSAGHPEAVEAGMGILADGGNAVDAAIAAAFAISVVEPFASGLGGGGAALIVPPGGEALSYDYRDEVPTSGRIPSGNIGVPGFVAGMGKLHATHGTGDFARLLEPAIRLAEEGAETSESLAYWLRSGGVAPSAAPQFFPDGAPLAAGDVLVQEELAATLRAIAEEGPGAFHDGALADELAAAVGAVDAASLAAYEVRRTEPAVGDFAGYRVVSSSPPLAGASVIQFLQLVEAAGVAEDAPGSADYIDTVTTAWGVAEDHLNRMIADPEFTDVPVDELTDPERNADLAAGTRDGGVARLGASDPSAAEPDGNTTHITVVGGDGTMVAMTNTLSNFWGSGRYALGFFLNDQLRNFGNRPGSPNEPPEAGKRTVASSSPTVLVDGDGRPVLGLGSPGGRRIPNILVQVLTRWALHDQDLAEAVEAPRFHQEGGQLVFEEVPTGQLADALSGRGLGTFSQMPFPYYFGSVQALLIDYEAQQVSGAVDPRREGDWRVEGP